MKIKPKSKTSKGSVQRRVKPRLSDLVKAAHAAGANVQVSLQPKKKPYWQVQYRHESGHMSSVSITSELGVVQMVARLLDSENTAISVMRGETEAA